MTGRAGVQPIRKLMRRLALLTIIAGALVTACALGELIASEQRECRARAQLVADAMASRVARAVGLGIPLSRLEGVDALFAERMRAQSDFLALALLDVEGRILSIHSRDAGVSIPEGPSATASVSRADAPIGSVKLVWREAGVSALMLRWMLPLAAFASALSALAALGLRLSWSRGACASDALALAACRRIRAGDFSSPIALLPRREFDMRLPWLTAELRNVNEQYLRVCRLVQSLNKTEPDADRRAALAQVLAETTGQDRFRDGSPQSALEAPGAHEARRRWLGMLLAVAAWLLATLAQVVLPATPAGWFPLAMLAAALCVTALVAFRLAGGGQSSTGGFTRGIVAVGPGLAIPLLLLAGPDAYFRLGAGGDALLAWSLLASLWLALAHCVALRRRLRRPAP